MTLSPKPRSRDLSFSSIAANGGPRCFRSSAAVIRRAIYRGEVASPQQCLPAKPAPYARQKLTDNLRTRTHAREPPVGARKVSHPAQRRTIRSVRSREGHRFIFPGFDGGAEWGGAAADPETGILHVNSNEMAWRRFAREEYGREQSKEPVHESVRCLSRRDDGGIAARDSVCGRVGEAALFYGVTTLGTIRNGKGRMQGFPNLQDDEVFACLLSYLTRGEKKKKKKKRDKAEKAELAVRENTEFDQVSLSRIPEVSRPGRISGGRPALGYIERHQSKYRRICMEDSAGRVSGTGG